MPVSGGSTSSRYGNFGVGLLETGLAADSYSELSIFWRGGFERLRRRRRKKRRIASRARAPRPAPTPMPIFAPVLRPDEVVPLVVPEPAPAAVAEDDEEDVVDVRVLLLDVNVVMELLLACVVEELAVGMVLVEDEVDDEELVVEAAELNVEVLDVVLVDLDVVEELWLELLLVVVVLDDVELDDVEELWLELLLMVVVLDDVDGGGVGVVRIELGDLPAKNDMVPPLLRGKKAMLLKVAASLKATFAEAASVQAQGEPASRVEGLPSCTHSAQTPPLLSQSVRPIQGWSTEVSR